MKSESLSRTEGDGQIVHFVFGIGDKVRHRTLGIEGHVESLVRTVQGQSVRFLRLVDGTCTVCMFPCADLVLVSK